MIIQRYQDFRNIFATTTTVANDGFYVWPVANVGQAGFTGLTRSTVPVTFPITLHATGSLNADSSFGVDEFDWYLSQRTDDPSDQYLSITVVTPTTVSYSGSIQISKTSLGTATYPGVTEDDLIGLFRHVDIYVQKRSNNLIQHAIPLNSLLADL